MDNNKDAIEYLTVFLQEHQNIMNFADNEGAKLYHGIRINAFKTALEALEKQVPVKPVLESNYECGKCRKVLKEARNYCPNCGQKLD